MGREGPPGGRASASRPGRCAPQGGGAPDACLSAGGGQGRAAGLRVPGAMGIAGLLEVRIDFLAPCCQDMSHLHRGNSCGRAAPASGGADSGTQGFSPVRPVELNPAGQARPRWQLAPSPPQSCPRLPALGGQRAVPAEEPPARGSQGQHRGASTEPCVSQTEVRCRRCAQHNLRGRGRRGQAPPAPWSPEPCLACPGSLSGPSAGLAAHVAVARCGFSALV